MSSSLKIIDVGLQAALYTKFNSILSMTSMKDCVLFYPKEVAQREFAERQGKTELEFISYWRTETSIDRERGNTPAARRGMWLPYVVAGQDDKTVQVKSVPVSMTYIVYFWSKEKEKLNQICEEYLFWQYTDPNLHLLYQERYPLELDLHFGPLSDESVIVEKYEKGMYFVYSMPITIDGWAFVSSDPINNIIKSIHVMCFDKDDLQTYDELVTHEDSVEDERVEVLKLFARIITE